MGYTWCEITVCNLTCVLNFVYSLPSSVLMTSCMCGLSRSVTTIMSYYTKPLGIYCIVLVSGLFNHSCVMAGMYIYWLPIDHLLHF